MRSSAFVLLSLTISVAAQAQSRAAELLRRAGDSSAVAQFVERFHAALAADDTAAIYRMLAPSAAYVDKDKILSVADFRAGSAAAKGRWERAVERQKGAIHVRVAGDAAWAYWVWPMHAKAQPDLLKGTEAELIVLTRQGASWQIQAIHFSLAGS
jgi:ketosteroid isomerase-like protein